MARWRCDPRPVGRRGVTRDPSALAREAARSELRSIQPARGSTRAIRADHSDRRRPIAFGRLTRRPGTDGGAGLGLNRAENPLIPQASGPEIEGNFRRARPRGAGGNQEGGRRRSGHRSGCLVKVAGRLRFSPNNRRSGRSLGNGLTPGRDAAARRCPGPAGAVGPGVGRDRCKDPRWDGRRKFIGPATSVSRRLRVGGRFQMTARGDRGADQARLGDRDAAERQPEQGAQANPAPNSIPNASDHECLPCEGWDGDTLPPHIES